MNPLLDRSLPIRFDLIRPEHIRPALDQALREARAAFEAYAQDTADGYDAVIGGYERIFEQLNDVHGIVLHYLNVRNTPEIRSAYEAVSGQVDAFHSEVALDSRVWHRIRSYVESPGCSSLPTVERRHAELTLRELRRGGAALDQASRDRVREIDVELSQLSRKFMDNVTDSTDAFTLNVTEPERVAGIAADVLAEASARARDRGQAGWTFNLSAPCYEAVIEQAHDRELRRTMYEAFIARGATPAHDNRPIVRRILALRQELARTLGYENYAEYALETRMVGSLARARSFMTDLTRRFEPPANLERARLSRRAQELGLTTVEPWDVRYLERRERSASDFDEEEVRAYLELDAFIEALFRTTREVFGVLVQPTPLPVWHPTVTSWEARDEGGGLLGYFYMDLFPREGKTDGAWVMPLRTEAVHPLSGEGAPQVAVLCANLPAPTAESPSLLTLNDAVTLFHEMGHMLHHLCSEVQVASLAGLSVPADFVELPSQLFENWVWQPDWFTTHLRHYKTGDAPPAELIQRARTARQAGAGLYYYRYWGRGVMDLELHSSFDPSSDEDPFVFSRRIRAPYAFAPAHAENDSLAAFQHIFGWNYAAGYYAYFWAEMLDADVFEQFRRAGIDRSGPGRHFRDLVLARGWSDEPDQLYRQFCGRGPEIDAFIRRTLPPGKESSAA